jgi:hypothetical protein
MPILEVLNENQKSTNFNLFLKMRHWLPNYSGLIIKKYDK